MVDFCPSTSEELVIKSLKYAGYNTIVSTKDLSPIKNACKPKLYEQENLWRKNRAKTPALLLM